MRIPMSRRLAYMIWRITRSFDLHVIANRLERIGAPEHVIDPKTDEPLFYGRDSVRFADFFRYLYGLSIVAQKQEKTGSPEVFKLVLYVAPFNYPRNDWSYLNEALDQSSNQGSVPDSGSAIE